MIRYQKVEEVRIRCSEEECSSTAELKSWPLVIESDGVPKLDLHGLRELLPEDWELGIVRSKGGVIVAPGQEAPQRFLPEPIALCPSCAKRHLGRR